MIRQLLSDCPQHDCGSYLHTVRCVGTLHHSHSSSLCHAGSSVGLCHFSLLCGRGENVCVCVFVWKAHLVGKETCNPTPSPADLKPSLSSPNSSLSAYHPTFFLSLHPGPWGERWICVWSGWCHSWQSEVLEFRGMNCRNYVALFTLHAGPGKCMWGITCFSA